MEIVNSPFRDSGEVNRLVTLILTVLLAEDTNTGQSYTYTYPGLAQLLLPLNNSLGFAHCQSKSMNNAPRVGRAARDEDVHRQNAREPISLSISSTMNPA